MSQQVTIIITAIISIFASSGFWAYITSKSKKDDAEKKLLTGLGYDRIAHLGMTYIERGWLTQDEYTNFYDYLYLPYKAMDGIPSADKIVEEVTRRCKIVRTPPAETKGGTSNG